MGPKADKFYLTWDSAEDREKIVRERFPSGKGLLVLDEIHKNGILVTSAERFLESLI
ncbi:hypothetical protein Cabys_126 [Caldithrix abyssi DSM 13497]|uniref:Uncharacterized protein n=2 Tax=Caldithrix abyssi TaxID=187145 RepID=A0A1J1C2G5_CALAY|nr:hypothetical protein Cabys_126 [Caldithrix abyssi DSM 13497]